MLSKIKFYIEKHHLLNDGCNVLVGLSGGADSVALIHALKLLGYNCFAAHCNFHLRGEESERDQLFVKSICKILQIPLYTKDFNTKDYATQNHISIEMAARKLRYEWFDYLCAELKIEHIAVGHHADDNIETLLINLTRGTGIKGLTGMPSKNYHIVRPMLSCSRKEIEEYLKKNTLSFVDDSTNRSNDYIRNKFRNQVIPLLEEINPSVRNTLYNSIERFKAGYHIYEIAVEQIKKDIVRKEGNWIKIDIEKLSELDEPETILFETLYPFGFTPENISLIFEHLNSESGKQFYSDKFQLTKDRNYFILKPIDILKENFFIIKELDCNQELPFKMKLNYLKKNNDFIISKINNHIHLDASKLNFPLMLRHWQKGDRFIPYGMTNFKKLSDFFIDYKISRPEKENLWLLVSGNDIIWIVGMRIDNRYKVTNMTENILEITINF